MKERGRRERVGREGNRMHERVVCVETENVVVMEILVIDWVHEVRGKNICYIRVR